MTDVKGFFEWNISYFFTISVRAHKLKLKGLLDNFMKDQAITKFYSLCNQGLRIHGGGFVWKEIQRKDGLLNDELYCFPNKQEKVAQPQGSHERAPQGKTRQSYITGNACVLLLPAHDERTRKVSSGITLECVDPADQGCVLSIVGYQRPLQKGIRYEYFQSIFAQRIICL